MMMLGDMQPAAIRSFQPSSIARLTLATMAPDSGVRL